MTSSCPKCGRENRPGARFCAACGATLTGSAAGNAATSGGAAVDATSPAKLGPALAQAGAALAPVAKQAAAKGWASSKRGMSLLARVFTIGGRAAYSELFRPLPVGGGQVVAAPVETAVPAPLEPAAFIFVLSLLAGWLVFALPVMVRAIVIVGFPILLLFLNWLGVRRPYFTALTFVSLFHRLRNRWRPFHVPLYKFPLADRTVGNQVEVVMIGPLQGTPPTPGAVVEVWGIRHPGRNELRAWRVEGVDPTGQSVSVLTTPRLIPLTVALFLPSVLLIIVWIISLVL